ncbi:MAG: hypothetical protein K2Q18_09945 [Bdellovibrionales bacterium]|nr:hypothetical protein [Bdellovibrionales bacterium]
MKKTLMLLGVLLLSVSCVELNGTLSVSEAFSVKKKSGFLNLKTKLVKVEKGQYQAELKSKSSRNLSLKLKGGSLGEIDIPIKSSDGLNIPADGQIYIEGKKIDQPFNVSGSIATDIDHYGYDHELLKCQFERVEKHCEKVCDKETQKCDVVCKEVTVTFEGLKDVDYHYRRTDRQASLEFMAEGSTAIVATLPVRGIETDKIIDRESACR